MVEPIGAQTITELPIVVQTHMFDKVVKLTVNQRVQVMTSEQVQFRDLLLQLRTGESTVDDWNLLLTRQPSNLTNLCNFEDAIRLFYSRKLQP